MNDTRLKPWERQYFEICGKKVDIRHNGIWYRNVTIKDRDIKRLTLFCESEDGTEFELTGGSWSIQPIKDEAVHSTERKTYPSKVTI